METSSLDFTTEGGRVRLFGSSGPVRLRQLKLRLVEMANVEYVRIGYQRLACPLGLADLAFDFPGEHASNSPPSQAQLSPA